MLVEIDFPDWMETQELERRLARLRYPDSTANQERKKIERLELESKELVRCSDRIDELEATVALLMSSLAAVGGSDGLRSAFDKLDERLSEDRVTPSEFGYLKASVSKLQKGSESRANSLRYFRDQVRELRSEIRQLKSADILAAESAATGTESALDVPERA